MPGRAASPVSFYEAHQLLLVRLCEILALKLQHACSSRVLQLMQHENRHAFYFNADAYKMLAVSAVARRHFQLSEGLSFNLVQC